MLRGIVPAACPRRRQCLHLNLNTTTIVNQTKLNIKNVESFHALSKFKMNVK